MRDAQVDVLIAADEMFTQFYPRDKKRIVKKGARRVGSSKALKDEKAGFTTLVMTEFFSQKLLEPFVVFTGSPDGRLYEQFHDYEGAMCFFQKSHWMDVFTMKEVLNELIAMFPGGGNWDYLGSCILSYLRRGFRLL